VGLGAGHAQGTDPLHTHPGQASLSPRPDPAACHPYPLPVYSACIYSRGSGGGPQPPPCAVGGLGCVSGWPMDSLS
jgi:hypothetical protein